MASIYKRKQDAGRKRQAWYICYKDHDGRKRTKKGFTDKKETELLAAKLELDAMRRREGLIDPEEENRLSGAKPRCMVILRTLKRVSSGQLASTSSLPCPESEGSSKKPE